MRNFSRLRLMLAALALSMPLMAAAADTKPPALEPVPEPPPPPPGFQSDEATEPQVTIVKRGEDTIEEYRINGQLYMQKVTPSHGVPYYLVKENVDGGWARMDGPGERLSIPQWVLFRF
jgi:hypothetical protein